jgi:hypothetical protein
MGSGGIARDPPGAKMTPPMRGVRSGAWAPPGLKRLMARSLARRNLVSYEIIAPAQDRTGAESAPRAEKRATTRRRLRLRSAKLLDSRNEFICECLVRDESAQGLCLKLMRNIGLPGRCILYDDESGAVSVVATIWRRGPLLGVRYCPLATPVAIKPSDRAALRGRYYAVLD